jgi:uncharacterized cysteine cluster protein YcgN (CxxCxxCC family)
MSHQPKRRIDVSGSARSCIGCTKCCDGWLSAVIDDEPMYPGRPCKYVEIGRGCSNYKDRPVDPCVKFKCEWLTNHTIPEWMKPSVSNAIVTSKETGGVQYFTMVGTGDGLNEDVLSWYVLWGLGGGRNILWRNRHGSQYHLGSKEFGAAVL